MPKSLPYHPFRIDFLKEKTHSALYIESFLEENEPEPELLLRVLTNVAEALAEEKMTSEQAKIHREKLDRILSKKGSDAIYSWAGWLKELGFKLTVTVDEIPEDNSTKSESWEEATVS